VHIGATAFLGIEVGPSYSSGAGFGSGAGASGVVIEQTIPGSPAAKSALTPGDVIVSVNGRTVTTTTSLDEILATYKSGESVKIGYVDQNGVHSTLSLRLGSGPPQ
jgi:S1-C subfamily serine protease